MTPETSDGLGVPEPVHPAAETPAGRRSSAASLAPPGDRPGPDRQITDSQLAILLRQVQWTLGDAAFDWPRGRVSAQQREELAGTLESLASIVRVSTPAG